jgi:hypothetical protein
MTTERTLFTTRAIDSKPPTPPAKFQWGPWKLNKRGLYLAYASGTWDEYRIGLDRCLSSAQVLDWLAQINAKTWATPYIVGCLMAAFHNTLGPQATLCSFGRDTRIDRADLRRVVDRNLGRWGDYFVKKAAKP